MIGKKRIRKEKKNKTIKNNKKPKINKNSKNIIPKIKTKKEIEKSENKNNIESIFNCFDTDKNSKNMELNNSSKLDFRKIKEKLKKIDNNIEENNISIINNIDRLTSILSSIIIAQNEQKTNENNDSEERIFKNNDESFNLDNICPEIIDINKDKNINYLLSLNDSMKKRINNDMNFNKICQIFTDYSFENLEKFINKLKNK